MASSQILVRAADALPWPDFLVQAAIRLLVGRTRRRLSGADGSVEAQFARDMETFPIALDTEKANEQHYELPPQFFELMLGPQRKYSCCFYPAVDTPLHLAEEQALALTAEHAGLADGQQILELGCGWGSLSLWMARRFPAARIHAVSNSQSQRSWILGRAEHEGLRNLTVEVADMNSFTTQLRFDRVVSVEMFEHMSNWPVLLQRVATWVKSDGLIFIHVFNHRRIPYRFDAANSADWIARYFFTGGIMPSAGLIAQFGNIVTLEQRWDWSGDHYSRTARDWLANYDRNADEIRRILIGVYGEDAALWNRRWRLFLHATAGLFGNDDGRQWGVSHYRLRPTKTN
jgi:cyclopropane-fatty-acyl-phospholipid synthase